ncbi:MAG: autotransporter outer membrane beta-barrel domain-containing protein [Gammaproteobacteria bacterium]|nr:autotransporter domain-containing protein [Gammaproteobacteria bacterium]NIN60872.1 autotransporter domain-containing protein [Gammaproteobacteria bacterium]NIO62495.1 autotransporter domain-containing protein [Gammaproteobacteria bacterium]NIP49586.1 autotransporter outer membrane beta-barrel domain-containing protein [Gammaproteobacteria bacterium]NIQ10811.1 autotransporter outer membrane beta-barrel domain-containing protein [Gammaproteobacteria bacterium]
MKRTSVIALIYISCMITSSVNASQECNEINFSFCLNGVGPAVTNPDVLRITASNVAKQNKTEAGKQYEESFSFKGDHYISGHSAGDLPGGWGIWGSYTRTSFEADLPINSVVQPIASYDGDQDIALFGADRFFGEQFLVGLAFGYERTDTDTAYNGGNNEADGYTVAPYVAYLINDVFSVDVTAGYSDLKYETVRIDNVSGGRITGNFDSSRWFMAANLNAIQTYRQWVFGGQVGFLYTDEKQDAYNEVGPNTARSISKRKLDLKQFLIGTDVAYSMNGLEPFVSVYYFNDISRNDGEDAGGLPSNIGATQPDDDDEFQVGVGVRYFYKDNISGTLEYNKVLNRNKFDADIFMFMIRLDL